MVYGSNGRRQKRSKSTVIILFVVSSLSACILLAIRFELSRKTLYPLHSIGWQKGARGKPSKAKVIKPAPVGAGVGVNEGSMLDSIQPGLGGAFGTWKPTTTWAPHTINSRPITQIQLVSCILPPSVFNLCSPKTNPKEILLHGEWTRIERDLNMRAGSQYLFLFVRRLLPSSSAPVVTNITLLSHSPTIEDLPGKGVWVGVSESLRSGTRGPALDRLMLHYRLNTQVEIRSERIEPITELDVIYGDASSQPLWSFEKVSPMITGGADDSSDRLGTALAVRKGIVPIPAVPQLKFSTNGTFKILQVADLHFSTGKGSCRDMAAGPQLTECEKMGADAYSLTWLERAINLTSPSLIAFTGDQLNGQDSSWSSQTGLMKFAPTLFKAKIPWTVIFGNHDSEVGASRVEQMALMRSMPYFIGEAGEEGVDGVGNYVRSIQHATLNQTLFNLYFLDSHANAKKWGGYFSSAQYDWIKPSQINWYRSMSSKARPYLRPFTPTVSAISTTTLKSSVLPIADYEELDRRSPQQSSASADDGDDDTEINTDYGMMPDDGSRITNTAAELEAEEERQTFDFEAFDALQEMENVKFVMPVGPTKLTPMMAKPNAMTFFHIPLIESYSLPIDLGLKGRLMMGERLEGSGAAKTNSGFFTQALLSQGELVASKNLSAPIQDEFWEGESEQTSGRSETKVIVNGHCHISDDCRRLRGIWSCFGGGASFSGYGKEGWARRMRVYEISEFGERIVTFKLLDSGTKVDEMVLVGEGAME